MVVSSLIAAALTLAVLLFVAIRLFGHGDVPYFTPSRRVNDPGSALAVPALAVPALALETPRPAGAARATLVRSRRRRV